METVRISQSYRDYIGCLNLRDWDRLGDFVHPAVRHNDRPLGLPGYRAMLEADVRAIPDLSFEIGMLIAEPPRIAARLLFTCTPSGVFLGVPVNGRTVTFAENVLYTYLDGRIAEVWSVIDKVAIEAQL